RPFPAHARAGRRLRRAGSRPGRRRTAAVSVVRRTARSRRSRVSSAELIELLSHGEITVKGRMPWSSNATFLAEVCSRELVTLAVYKPARGERQLWDFPSGLGSREVAAYELSEALAWGIVPETVLRREGPMGQGSLQRFVPADFEHHYFTL